MGTENLKILKKSLKTYGVEKTILVCMEELSELIQAISKIERYPDEEIRKYNLVEEIADVNVIVEYLKIIYDINNEDISEWTERKLSRLSKILGDE